VSERTSETTLHRALGDARRSQIVRELESEGGPLDADELARRVGLHPNTVRFHLGVLTRAGVVGSRPEARTTPGRPRILYALERAYSREGRDEYRLLATVLSGLVSRSHGGSAAAEEAGERWGHELVRGERPARDEAEAVAHVVDLLDEQGFEPVAEGRVVEMHRCPFHDLAETSPEVVCAVHRGLISGALEELGQDLAVERLEIFPRPDVCIARLAPRHAA
jgi:predicted ArsR family transcriptional regulator